MKDKVKRRSKSRTQRRSQRKSQRKSHRKSQRRSQRKSQRRSQRKSQRRSQRKSQRKSQRRSQRKSQHRRQRGGYSTGFTLPEKDSYLFEQFKPTLTKNQKTFKPPMSMLNTNVPKKHSKSFDFYKWFYGSDISILDIKDKTYGDFIMSYNVKYPHMLLDINNIFKDKKLNVYKYPKELFQKSVYDLFGVEKGNMEDPGIDAIWNNLLPNIFINGPYRSYNNGVIYYDDDKQINEEFSLPSFFTGDSEDAYELDGGGNLYPQSPLSELKIGGRSTDIFFLSLPNQKEKGELEKLFGLMKAYGITDIINFQSCAGILQSEGNDEQVRSWHKEFYNPDRPEQWSNCQYIPKKYNKEGKQIDTYGNLLSYDTIKRINTLLKDRNGRPIVDLEDRMWTGNKQTYFDDHVMMSSNVQGNTVINYKTIYDSDGRPLDQEIPLTYENWNIHWSDGSSGNEEMWSLLTSCVLRTYCLEKRKVAIHCWGGYGRTCSGMFLTLMLKIIYQFPSERQKIQKLCYNWFKNIANSGNPFDPEIKQFVNHIFTTYGLFGDNNLTEFDTSSGETSLEQSKMLTEFNKLIRSINSGMECGDSCKGPYKVTHNNAAKVRKEEVLKSHCLKSRMDFIMQQLLYVLEMFSDNAELLSPNWNPYIRELYQFLKSKDVIKVPQQSIVQQPIISQPIISQPIISQPVQNEISEGSPSLSPSLPPSLSPSLSPSNAYQPEGPTWHEWGMGKIRGLRNMLGYNTMSDNPQNYV